MGGLIYNSYKPYMNPYNPYSYSPSSYLYLTKKINSTDNDL